jgi:hypothetical protein
MKTQASIVGGAASYEIDGEQYVAVVAGQGGGRGGYWAPNYARLLVYKIGGGAELPEQVTFNPPVLNPPANFGSTEDITMGEQHYNANCASCHGNSGRVSSLFPDLRYAAALNSPELFQAIVIDGALQNNGMVSFRDQLTPDQADQIRAYVVRLANEAKDAPPAPGLGGPPPANAAPAPAPAPAAQRTVPAPAAPAAEVHQ